MYTDYKIIYSYRKTMALEIKNGELIVRVPYFATKDSIEDFVEKNRAWIDKHLKIALERQRAQNNLPKLSAKEIHNLADEALAYIPERVKYFAPLVGVEYGRITIRNQKTRWGSCSSKGNLNFNCLLMLTPPEVIDSVVVHELCHLLEMNHSKLFYAHVLRVMPNYFEAHAYLKAHGEEILSRMK